MCHLDGSPVERHNAAEELIVRDLASLEATGYPLTESDPEPDHLVYNDATIDASTEIEQQLQRDRLESLLPLEGDIIPPPEAEDWLISELSDDFLLALSSIDVTIDALARFGVHKSCIDFPPEHVFRGMLHCIPPTGLTLSSWVAKVCIFCVAYKWGFEVVDVRLQGEPDGATGLMYSAPYPPPRFSNDDLHDIQEDLEKIPIYLRLMAVRFAAWLVFELEDVDDATCPPEFQAAFCEGSDLYKEEGIWPGCEIWPGRQPWIERRSWHTPSHIFTSYLSHVFQYLSQRQWFDLPFADNLADSFLQLNGLAIEAIATGGEICTEDLR